MEFKQTQLRIHGLDRDGPKNYCSSAKEQEFIKMPLKSISSNNNKTNNKDQQCNCILNCTVKPIVIPPVEDSTTICQQVYQYKTTDCGKQQQQHQRYRHGSKKQHGSPHSKTSPCQYLGNGLRLPMNKSPLMTESTFSSTMEQQ